MGRTAWRILPYSLPHLQNIRSTNFILNIEIGMGVVLLFKGYVWLAMPK